MANLMQMPGNSSYYTDGNHFYKYHQIASKNDPLYIFAAQDLGINLNQRTDVDNKKINELAGTGRYQKTQYRLLKNGLAVDMPYDGDLPVYTPGDIILWKVDASTVPGLVRHSCSSYSLPGPVCSVCQKPFP